MDPHPISECAPSSPKLAGRVALITGGDSGIGRAMAYAFVKEGAKVAVAYYDEDRDAQETAARIRQLGSECLLLRGDLRVPAFAKSCVERTVERFGGLDILVNNHAVQFIHPLKDDDLLVVVFFILSRYRYMVFVSILPLVPLGG